MLLNTTLWHIFVEHQVEVTFIGVFVKHQVAAITMTSSKGCFSQIFVYDIILLSFLTVQNLKFFVKK